jgi:hypothetical protein
MSALRATAPEATANPVANVSRLLPSDIDIDMVALRRPSQGRS